MGDYNGIDLSHKILDRLSIHDVIYAEIAEPGAMGNEGGIIIHAVEEGYLIIYETNIFEDDNCYKAAREFLFKHQNGLTVDGIKMEKDVFNYHYGGMGNHVLINKKVDLSIHEDHFTFDRNSNQYKIFCSVLGVFNSVVYSLNNSKK